MPGAMPHQVVSADAFHALDVKSRAGEILGHFHGLAIYEKVRDRRGDTYSFMGLAPTLPDGRVDVDSIGRGQWLVDGRLIYVRQPNAAG